MEQMGSVLGTVLAWMLLAGELVTLGLVGWSQWRYPPLDAVTPQRTPLAPVSIVVAAHNEAGQIGDTVDRLARLHYPQYEVLVVDDRSDDATPAILAEASKGWPLLRTLRIDQVPAKWLGKTYALWRGAQAARYPWLLFLDADSKLDANALARAMTVAKTGDLDYLTVIPRLTIPTFWGKAFLAYFGMVLALSLRPWFTNRPGGRVAMGVGAFQLVRAQRYWQMHGHSALALAVADDVQLATQMKRSGGRTYLLLAGTAVTLPWYPTVKAAQRGFEKNLYSLAGLSLPGVATLAALMLLGAYGPWLMAVWTGGALAWASGLIVAWTLLEFGLIGRDGMRLPFWGVAAYPLMPALFVWILLASAYQAERQGGIWWGGRFYGLAQLRQRRGGE